MHESDQTQQALERVQSNWKHVFTQTPEAAFDYHNAFGGLSEFNLIGHALARLGTAALSALLSWLGTNSDLLPDQ